MHVIGGLHWRKMLHERSMHWDAGNNCWDYTTVGHQNTLRIPRRTTLASFHALRFHDSIVLGDQWVRPVEQQSMGVVSCVPQNRGKDDIHWLIVSLPEPLSIPISPHPAWWKRGISRIGYARNQACAWKPTHDKISNPSIWRPSASFLGWGPLLWHNPPSLE